MNKKTLIIVEGESEEVRILDAKNKGLLNLLDIDFEIVSICNPIYELYEAYKNGEYDDLVSYLATNNKLQIEEGKISKNSFSSIYLFFDFEPHYQKYSDKDIEELMSIFDNETEMGKLYINYPMVESFYHIKNIPDIEFMERTVCLKDFNGDQYKTLVNKETCVNHKPVAKHLLIKIMHYNYNKALEICKTDFENEIDYKKILQVQIELKNKMNKIYVLNTLALFPIDYNPLLFKNLLSSKL